jgi:hypothetical protein
MDTDLASLASLLAPAPSKKEEPHKESGDDVLRMLKKQGKEDSGKTEDGTKKKPSTAKEQKGKKRKHPVNAELQPYNAPIRKKKAKAPEAKAPAPPKEQPTTMTTTTTTTHTLMDCMFSPPQAAAPVAADPKPAEKIQKTSQSLKSMVIGEYFEISKKIEKQEARRITLENRKSEPGVDLEVLRNKQFVAEILLRLYKKQQTVILKYFPHGYMEF